VLWGSVFPAAQVALRTQTPYGLAWWRAVVAFGFLTVVAFAGVGPAIDLKRLRGPAYIRPAVLSWLQLTGFAVLFNFGVLASGPVVAAFVVNWSARARRRCWPLVPTA